jgi:adhesin/invasin
VTFAVATGGGSVTGEAATTGATGIATVAGWTLGTTAGPNTLTATVAGITPVVFTATATPGAPATVAIVSGDAQTAVAGTVLGAPLVIGVQDQFGNAVPGVTVGWSASDGSVAPASGLTDANGRAQTTWTLGQH